MTYKNIKTKNDFLPFKVGTIFNPLNIKIKKKSPLLKEIEIEYPTRLNAMALDPRKIAFNNNFVYTPGEIVFVTKIYKKINVKLAQSKKLMISERSKRKSLIKHSFLLMKKVIGFKNGLYIDVQNTTEIRHAGLGSSGSLIAGVAAAINEIFDNQINKEKLIRYLAQNHGEEIDGSPNLLNPVQCIGGSAAAGLFKKGGLIIIAGEASIIKTMNIDNRYTVLLGIPNDFKQVDSKIALGEELKKIQSFINSGNKYAEKIAYNILHSVLPAMTKNNLKIIGDIIYEYRYNMGSIKNCSFLYQKLPKLMKKISFLKTKGIVDVLSISSVGPTVFAITKRPDICVDIFKRNNLNVYITKIENNGYKINKKIFK